MSFVDMIIKKRNGEKLSDNELSFFAMGAGNGSIPDYQLSAMLMAMFLKGLDDEELTALTLAMAKSGEELNLSAIPGIKVDKHSTGGVADTATLVLAPLVAACGAPVVKMSGRGLGFSGGTIDKLDSISGFQTSLPLEQAINQCLEHGLVIMGQSLNLCPADKKLYSLRDVTGTVDSLPLIAASIMSKKLAAGTDAIVLDVKCGSGAFMKDEENAKALAEKMVSIGRLCKREVRALITDMNEPLGQYIGNSLEVIEAIEVLKGNIGGRLLEVSLELGAELLIISKITDSYEAARNLLLENIKNKKGLEKLREIICIQGGNPNIIDDYSLLPRAKEMLSLFAEKTGYISSMDTAEIGRAFLETGAGRKQKDDEIDYGAGIIMKVRIGDFIEKGSPIAEIYAKTNEKCKNAEEILSSAIKIAAKAPSERSLIIAKI